MVREPRSGPVSPVVTVAVPTLAADGPLDECLASLERQTFSDFEVIVIDNSGRRAVVPRGRVRVIANENNVGFGAAVNQAFGESAAPFLAVLNDDAVAHPGWLKALLDAVEERPDVGMCASQVRLMGLDLLDSAGMLLAGDGSSKQRGHRESWQAYARLQEALFPSGSAALYRREMLEEIGLFDESFFLYCEDTDLGLRARWAGWECLYVPDAVVEHRYSHSAGAASALKAYYVERNRLFVIFKNFPLADLLLVPFYATARFFWHAAYALAGRGKAAEFQRAGSSLGRLPLMVVRAHWELLGRFPKIWQQRQRMKRRLSTRQFRRLVRRFAISPRQVAAS
ncbi:MAG TPA: glycosyltransferase family 2 protein [Bryobacteraceae bacterium]|nr:glycosyltransferase family 2 protein [Bryobacteraceae bacterium]